MSIYGRLLVILAEMVCYYYVCKMYIHTLCHIVGGYCTLLAPCLHSQWQFLAPLNKMTIISSKNNKKIFIDNRYGSLEVTER